MELKLLLLSLGFLFISCSSCMPGDNNGEENGSENGSNTDPGDSETEFEYEWDKFPVPVSAGTGMKWELQSQSAACFPLPSTNKSYASFTRSQRLSRSIA